MGSCGNKNSIIVKEDPKRNNSSTNKTINTNNKDKDKILNTKLNENKLNRHTSDQLGKTATEKSNFINFLSKDDYIKGKLISKSFFGEVYNGLSSLDAGLVAIKVIDLARIYEGIKNNQELLDVKLSKLANELIKLKDIAHPNLIKYFFTDDSLDLQTLQLTLIYEFCNGASIEKLIEKYGNFEERTIKIYVKQLLNFLDFLHDNGFEHKRIIPSNILIDGDGTVRISDLLIDGFLLGESREEIVSNLITYKTYPKWIAPELIKAKSANSEIGKCDIWSLGCLILEMLKKDLFYTDVSEFKSNEEFINFISNLEESPAVNDKYMTKQCRLFIEECLEINPSKRASAKKLLDHEFLTQKIPIKNFSVDDKEIKEIKEKTITEEIKEQLKAQQQLLEKNHQTPKNELANDRRCIFLLTIIKLNQRIANVLCFIDATNFTV